ncbi:hypothetical protein [Hyphomicrobium sp. ghe19]|uniref:hypothetical protein n=1 Tax=Hyphomicrobium sp. ghe19 TaxID=2682968 RepID=UPI001366E483|nr:hypothetical protein HYPP_04449 [Hyphomicrobium sp. ghe19]
MTSNDEIEFASLFAATRYGQSAKSEARIQAERRAVMTDKQRSRGGRARSVQMNYRCTPAHKALISGLSEHMDVSAADMFEEAVALLAKKKGYKGASDAS